MTEMPVPPVPARPPAARAVGLRKTYGEGDAAVEALGRAVFPGPLGGSICAAQLLPPRERAAVTSGAAVVSVFVEVEGEAINAYVRDGGTGFDMTAVATDRRSTTSSRGYSATAA